VEKRVENLRITEGKTKSVYGRRRRPKEKESLKTLGFPVDFGPDDSECGLLILQKWKSRRLPHEGAFFRSF